MLLHKKITALRKEQKWSQRELAEKLKTDYRNISRWETGKNIPDTNMVIKLADIFGVTTDYLLYDNVPRNGKSQKIDDPELLEQIEAIKNLKEEDKNVIKHLISAVIFKNKVEVLSNK